MSVEGPERGSHTPTDQPPPQSQLFQYDILDEKDATEKKLEECFHRFSHMVEEGAGQEGDQYAMLYQVVNKSMDEYKNVCLAMMYSLLTDKQTASKWCEALFVLSRDNMSYFLRQLTLIITDKFPKLLASPREQLYWLTNHMVTKDIVGVDKLCVNLMKQIQSGDISDSNIWLADSMLQLLCGNKTWMLSQPFLMPTALYIYLRLIAEHNAPNLHVLRQNEVDFCVGMLRERFRDCCQIGRDLLRLLQSVAAIPEFYKLWEDIQKDPTSLDPSFTGVYQLLATPTDKQFVSLRITPDMDLKLRFLADKVKFGMQRRYQDWFQRQYLSTHESQFFISDIIRYICCSIHPPNEIIGSDVVQRWALIGWLHSLCTTQTSMAEARLALFYDYLAYDPDQHKIMNVEPAILLMHHSVRTHTAMVASLLEFICKIVDEYLPGYESKLLQGFKSAFTDITNKKVVTTLSFLFENPILDINLRCMIKQKFPEFLSPLGVEGGFKHEIPDDITDMSTVSPTPPISFKQDAEDMSMGLLDSPTLEIDNELEGKAEFSDSDEEGKPPSPLRPSPITPPEEMEAISEQATSSELSAYPIEEVPDEAFNEPVRTPLSEDGSIFELSNPDLADKLNLLKSYSGLDEFPGELELFLKGIDFRGQDENSTSQITTCLASLLSSELHPSAIAKEVQKPVNSQDNEITDMEIPVSPSTQVTLFRLAVEDPNVMLLLQKLAQYIPMIGFTFLVFLSESEKDDFSLYFDYAEPNDCKGQLVRDLTTGAEMAIDTFFKLLPRLYKDCSEHMVGNGEVLKVVVASLDPSNLHELVCGLTMQEFSVFGQNNAEQVLLKSLEWETFEQICVWQLLEAESVPVAEVLPIVPYLSKGDQYESLTGLILYLKSLSPEGPILKALVASLPDSPGVHSLLLHWTHKVPETLARALTSLLHQLGETNSELHTVALRHIVAVHNRTDEFLNVLKDADLVKRLLDLLDGNDSLKEEFESFFTSLQQTKTSRRKSPQKGGESALKRSGDTVKMGPKTTKKRRRLNND